METSRCDLGSMRIADLLACLGSTRPVVYSIPGHCDITVTRIRFMLEFGAEAEYVACGEFGTYKTAARPYIRPALDANQQRILEKRLKVLPFIVGS